MDRRQRRGNGGRRDRAWTRYHRGLIHEGRNVRFRADLDPSNAHASITVAVADAQRVAHANPDRVAHALAGSVPHALADSVPGVYRDPSPTPTRTPTPAPTATPAPAPVLVSGPALQFAATGPAYAKTIAVVQANYDGQFSLSGTSCNGIAVADTTTSPQNFTITPLAAGSCTYTVTGGGGSQTTLPVAVTTTTATITIP